MRYVFNRAPVWVDDAVGFLLVAIVMLAAAQVLRRGEHIGVDLFTERLRAARARWAQAWAALAAGVVAVILVVNGWETAMQSRQFGIVTEGRIELPVWWLMLLLPAGGLLMALVAVESLWRLALGLPPLGRHRPHGGARMTVALILVGLVAAAVHRRADLRRAVDLRRRRCCWARAGWRR